MDAEERENARRRIDEIDALLAARRREIAELRVVLENRAPPSSVTEPEPVVRPPSGSRLRVVGALLLATAVGAAAWVSWTRPAPETPRYTRPEPVRVRVRVRIPGPRTLPPEPSARGAKDVDPGFRLRVPNPAYVEALAARCPRERPTLDAPPLGTSELALARCVGCACCGEPASEDDPFRAGSPASSDQGARCQECSSAGLLEQAGVAVRGGPPWSPLHSRYGLVMQLARPARFVALRVHATGGRDQRDGVPAAVLIAYDDLGRPLDAARAEAASDTASVEPDGEWTFVVEACPGEAIARVDHVVRNATTDFLAWAMQPAEPGR